MPKTFPRGRRAEMKLGGESVYQLARLGCTITDIAQYFQCSKAYVSKHWKADLHRGRAAMRMSILRMQFRRAQKGSDAMLIHLGKVYCGQRERLEVSLGLRKPQPVTYETGDDGRNPGLFAGPPKALPTPEPAGEWEVEPKS